MSEELLGVIITSGVTSIISVIGFIVVVIGLLGFLLFANR